MTLARRIFCPMFCLRAEDKTLQPRKRNMYKANFNGDAEPFLEGTGKSPSLDRRKCGSDTARIVRTTLRYGDGSSKRPSGEGGALVRDEIQGGTGGRGF